MKIDSEKLAKIACILYDISKDQIKEIYVWSKEVYAIEIHDGRCLFMVLSTKEIDH